MLTEVLTIAANEFLGVDPFLKGVAAVAIIFMSLALVGLATGLGARYPRFNAENASQMAGSYGGVAFMILAVSYILAIIVLLGWPASIYLFQRVRMLPLSQGQGLFMAGIFGSAALLSLLRGTGGCARELLRCARWGAVEGRFARSRKPRAEKPTL